MKTVIVPSLFLLVSMFNLTLIVAGLKEFIDRMGGDATAAALFFSIELFAYIIFAPIWGLLSDRVGRRKMFIFVGFLGSGIIYFAYIWITNLAILFVARFIQGAFSVMGWSTVMAMVLDQPNQKKRGQFMGLMGGALMFGVAMGAPVGGYLSSWLGAVAPVAVAAVLFVLLALCTPLLTDQGEIREGVRIREIISTLKSKPRLAFPYVFHFVDRYTVGFFVVLFPLFIIGLAGDDPAVRGRYLGLFLFPFAFLQYYAGKLTDRLGPYIPLLAGSFLYGVVMCLVGISNLVTLWPVLIALGILAAVMFSPAITLTAQLSDKHTRGSAMGGFNLTGSVGFAIGPLVAAWALSAGGFAFAFVMSGIAEILAAIIGAMAVWRWRTGVTEPAAQATSAPLGSPGE